MKRQFTKLILIAILFTPLSLEAAPVTFKFDNDVALNMVRGEIPAPIETTRFQDDSVSGSLTVDLDDLTKTTGTIKVDLADIQSHTFGDAGKNAKQTEHMINWFEIGPEVSKEVRDKFRWATFKISKITSVAPKGIKEAKPLKDEIGEARIFQATAEGELTIHGVSTPKTVDLDVVIYNVNPEGKRYKNAKRIIMLRTRKPMDVSLKAHDVKPRDTTGKFLSKALSVVGLKIADTAKISFDMRGFEAKK